MNSFKTSLLTPSGPLFDGQVISVNVPGTEGDFQILHNHAALMSSLDIGVARIKAEDNSVKEYFVSGGFVEVNNNEVIILAEAAESSDSIDVERAKASKERAEIRLKESGIDRTRAETSLKRAMNRLKLVGSL